MRKEYPSDITQEQFAEIEPDSTGGRKRTHPQKYEMYEIFCAVLYVLREGCRWRALPHDFPEWQNVYYHFRMWKEVRIDGERVVDKVLRKLVEVERGKKGRDEQTTMIIVDSRSVKNTDAAEEEGYDARKKYPELNFT